MDCYGWPAGTAEKMLTAVVKSGKAVKGIYTGDKPQPQWVNKANLEEIHHLTMTYLKRELAACAPYEVVDFMIRWQHRHPDHRRKGLHGLRQVIGQLQGYEVLQGVLESEVLGQRVEDYSPALLDKLIASGEVVWRRLSSKGLRRGTLTLCLRKDMEGKALGYLPDEALFAITNKDPANLHFSCLQILDERGDVFRSRQGNFISSQVIQAGQVLLFGNSHLLAKLSRKQLSRCLTALRDLGTALNHPVTFMLWNGHPIDVHPVAGFLYEQGFRFDGRGWLCWPPRGKQGKTPEPFAYEEFLPYYEEPDPVDYDYSWVVSRATPLIRPKFEELLNFLETNLTDKHRLIFDQSGFRVTYRGERCIWPYAQKKQIWMGISHKGWVPGIIVTPDTDLNGRDFKEEFNRQISRNMEIIDAYLAKRKQDRPTGQPG